MPLKLKLPALSVSVTDKVRLNNSELQHKKNQRGNNKTYQNILKRIPVKTKQIALVQSTQGICIRVELSPFVIHLEVIFLESQTPS